jgi:hypothetical protein
MKKKVAQYSNLGAALVSVRSKHGKSRQGRHDSTPGAFVKLPTNGRQLCPVFPPSHVSRFRSTLCPQPSTSLANRDAT